MIYFFHSEARNSEIIFRGDSFNHLKAQRKKEGEIIEVRNLEDDFKYFYRIIDISKKDISLILEDKEKIEKKPKIDLEIFWCIIDIKKIKEILPFLNQLNLKKLNLVYCDRSQKNFKIDLEKIKKILILSNEQSGRYDLMEVEVLNKISDDDWNELYFLDFGGREISNFDKARIKKILIGPEGGFSEKEREKIPKDKIIEFKKANVLRSETAVVSILANLTS